MRKLLAAVSKLPGQGAPMAVSEPRAKRAPPSDITPQDMGLPQIWDLPDVL